MRIRKRKVPLPISLLSPVPISDPHLFSRSPVTLQVQAATTIHGNGGISSSQPLDRLTSGMHRLIDDGSSSSSDHHQHHLVVKEQEEQQEVVGCCLGLKLTTTQNMPKNNNDASNVGITALGATTSSNGPLPFSNHGVSLERALWCDEDRVIPVKKRRGSFERASTDTATGPSFEMRSEENINVVLEQNRKNDKEVQDDEDDRNQGMEKAVVVSTKKGSKRGNTIMEGSRCSRVNGRGWRCCQQTLVGYSLCEHHLGKGRLRSMTSVRGRPSVSSSKKNKVATLEGVSNGVANSPLMQLCEAAKKESETLEINERKKALTAMKKVKLGVVKARSLSSLLGQTKTSSSS